MNLTNERWERDVLETVRRPSDPWFPELTNLLVRSGWQSLEIQSISPETYSTSSLIRRKFDTPSIGPTTAVACEFSEIIEFLSDDIQSKFSSNSYRFSTQFEVSEGDLIGVFSSALEKIALVPSLRASTNQLIRRVHFLHSNWDDSDISFSDPELPFSIFVSVPGKESSNAALRVAEAMIHESMHLQLSLLEKITPLVHSHSLTYFSPWRREHRDASGLLHALYVFTVINAWLERLPSIDCSYSKNRRSEIATQVDEIQTFDSAALTAIGDTLRRYLLAQHGMQQAPTL